MKRFYLLRHGQTDSNLSGIIQGQSIDVPLNEEGIEKSKKIAELLKGHVSRIVSSDLLRAYQTARIIGEILGVEIETDKRLREMNYGSWEGNFLDELMKTPEGKVWMENPSKWRIENSESVLDVQNRIIQAIKEYVQKYDDILFVSHGVTISAFLLYVKDLPLDNVKEYIPRNTQLYEFKFENDRFEEVKIEGT
ncbi:histidine phosphatase family protein [Athalassotoga saccharophila]|uniref:histidine phosphatase family protein n=1 Tax=Athalassotoga saccharophila TaxID=1441386 RepID=UPI0013796255|nr:histidine phosphatase family protein [Athalassotoga saccharophila]BBJ27137.1 putative phosphoserine phosphatase 2 [Athalassotoga saccharophila]